MPIQHIAATGVPDALPNIYSHAVRAGNFVYCSGSVGMTEGGKMVEGTVQDRTRQIINNLENVLKAAGLTLNNVCKVNIYLSDLPKDFTAMNEVYSAMMPTPKPARTCVGVAHLPAGGTDVEIEFTAYDG